MTVTGCLFTLFGIRCAYYLECVGTDAKVRGEAGTTPHGLKLLNIPLRYLRCRISRFQQRFPWSSEQPVGDKSLTRAPFHSRGYSEGLNCSLDVVPVVHRGAKPMVILLRWRHRNRKDTKIPQHTNSADMAPIVHGVVNRLWHVLWEDE